MPQLSDPLVLYAIAVVVALMGVELQKRWLLIVAKPIATLALIPLAMSGPATMTTVLVAAGLGFSVVGDTALLGKSRTAFVVGLFAFLVAHLIYAAAFLWGGGAGPVWSPLVGVVIFGTASGWLIKRMWGGLVPVLRVPLVLYCACCSAMAAVALGTLAGPWPPQASAAAAVGAVLFFLSDANIAWLDFVEPYPHGQTVTLTLYWTGQLGITMAACWASG